ncbi:hypothetical protein KJ966_23135 [bacterium]|nr:hypothetical protein [bacterium]
MKTNYLRKLKWIIAILTSVFLVQSCFSFKTWYGWLDTYISWQVDEYFDITSEQKDFMSLRLRVLLDSHKNNEIPKYIAFLQEIKSRLERDVVVEDIDWFRNSIWQFNNNLANILVDDVTEFLSGISDDQLVYLKEKLVEENRSWLEEHDSEEQSKEDRLESTYGRVEEWIGELTTEQKEKIEQMYQPNTRGHELRYQRRLTSQQRFFETMEARFNRETLKAGLLDWYLKPEEYYPEEYKQANRIFASRTDEMILMLSRTAIPEQRKYANRKLDDYIAQLEAILRE